MGWANALEVAIVSHRGCDRIRTGIVYTDLCLVMHHLKGKGWQNRLFER